MEFPVPHSAMVHVPLGLAVVMPLLAAGFTVAIWRGHLPRSVLAAVAALQLVLVGTGFAALQLGERDGELAERVAPEEAIEAHEEAAEAFLWTAAAVLVVAVGSVVVPRRAAPALGGLVTVGSLIVAAMAVNTGAKGGELVFRYGAGMKAARSAEGAPAARPSGDHD